jgi:hypothetical protein
MARAYLLICESVSLPLSGFGVDVEIDSASLPPSRTGSLETSWKLLPQVGHLVRSSRPASRNTLQQVKHS